jgi:hypothetical protein
MGQVKSQRGVDVLAEGGKFQIGFGSGAKALDFEGAEEFGGTTSAGRPSGIFWLIFALFEFRT